MDWQFITGIGLAVVFFFLQYAVKEMPPPITWGGVCLGILFIGWGLLPSHARMPLGPALLIISSASGLVGGGKWLLASYADAPDLLPALFIECHLGPMGTQGAPNGRIYALTVQEGSGGSGLAEYWSGDPAKQSNWISATGEPIPGYRCEVTSYAAYPLVNVTIPVSLKFNEAIPNDSGGVLSGKFSSQQTSLVQIPKIDPGSAGKFTFYIYSVTDKWADIDIESRGIASKPGENTKNTIEIIQQELSPIKKAVGMSAMFLAPSPLHTKGPPKSSPPTPTPPDTPTKK